MRNDDPAAAPAASWLQLEYSIERLHTSARSGIGVREFYRQLLEEAAASLAASGGAAWQTGPAGPELICQAPGLEGESAPRDWRQRRPSIAEAMNAGEANVAHDEPGLATVLCPVRRPGLAEHPVAGERSIALIELWMPAGAAPVVQQGWLDFARTLADVAADFHALEELRRLRDGAALHRQSVDLLRRVGRPRTLAGAAFEAANEGRRALACDRVSVVVRRGSRWRLASTSGVDRVDRRTDFSRRTERLADQVARWGEPLSAPLDAAADAATPPQLTAAIEAHLDHSHARTLACAPVMFAPREDASDADAASRAAQRRRKRVKPDMVLIAERFDATDEGSLRTQLAELGELCAPALARAAQLDRFPVRTLLNWSDRLAVLARPAKLAKFLLMLGAVVGLLAALILVPADFDVEAPATLVAAVEREVFASASGSVAEVRVEHGQQVAAGETLVVLHDPELLLHIQQTRGEIDAARKRLDALAIARTERTQRDQIAADRLPLAAEQRQLEERLASLDAQLKLLETRREALTLRSPIAGQVLTRDAQQLLASRPVERGQPLLTVADTAAGWQLNAEVPQRQIGHVIEAQGESDEPLAVSYRLAGDVQHSFPARLASISAAAMLEADGLQDATPPIEAKIAVEGDPPAAARSGMSASVRIHCGRQPIGYVWLHDVAATLYRWATF
jgi:multidrug efflux pump subunit AcrA (membrane-fusion protein)